MIRIERYNSEKQSEWDEFVRSAKNSSFLFERAFMDYHSDRFSDYSLMAYRDDKLLTVLPANRIAGVVYSHLGLTYGGWVMPLRKFNVVDMLEVMDAALDAMRADGVKELMYRPMPYIYHSYPAEEDLYALFRCGAQTVVTNVSTTIDLACPLHFNTGAKSSVSVACRNGVVIGESRFRWLLAGVDQSAQRAIRHYSGAFARRDFALACLVPEKHTTLHCPERRRAAWWRGDVLHRCGGAFAIHRRYARWLEYASASGCL